MARTRSIKPGFFDNELLGCLPPLTRLLFIGLWCQADREGRLEDRSRRLKKLILGYDDVTVEDVENMLDALAENGFIIRYEAAGNTYIQVVNFVKHQNPHMKEKPSEIPPPPGFAPSQPRESTRQAPGRNREDTGPAPEEDEESPGEPPEPPQEPPGGEGDGEEAQEPEPKGEPKKTALERRFELFWGAYPKKKSKEAARKAFKRVAPDEDLFDRIMAAIGRARTSPEWLREGGRFIPYPATWLNGGAWDDEPFKGVQNNGTTEEHYGGRPGPGQSAPAPGGATRGFKRADTDG